MGNVFLLLESCGYAGFFICGAFTTRDRAEKERLEECTREKRDPKVDKIYQVKELTLDVAISEGVRYSKTF